MTIADLDAKALGTNMKLAQSLYEARQEALNQMIMERLLMEEAAAQGITLEALISKLAGPAGLIYGPQVWQALQDHTDTDLSTWDMLRAGPGLLLGWPSREQRTLQRDDLIAMKAGYWRVNYDHIAPWIERHFD